MSSVANALIGAKKALASAENFTRSVEGRSTSMFAPKQHEYSAASYQGARDQRKSSSLAQEADSAGKGIKARMETEAAARKSIE